MLMQMKSDNTCKCARTRISPDFLQERNRDLIDAQRRVIAKLGEEAPYISKTRILKLVMKEPAKRFYVSFEEASRMLSKLDTGQDINRKGIRYDMYLELYNVLNKIKKVNPELTWQELVERAVLSPASGFFLEDDRAYKLLKR